MTLCYSCWITRSHVIFTFVSLEITLIKIWSSLNLDIFTINNLAVSRNCIYVKKNIDEILNNILTYLHRQMDDIQKISKYIHVK